MKYKGFYTPFIYFLFFAIFLALFGCLEQPNNKTQEVVPFKPEQQTTNTTQEPYYPVTQQTDTYVYPTKNFELSFLSVGLADATILLSKDKIILIDTADSKTSSLVISELQRRGAKKIDLLILSAPHDSSFSGGLKDILMTFSVNEIWINDKTYLEPYLQYLKNTKIKEVNFGDKYEYENLSIFVLNPFFDRIKNADVDSIALKISYNDLCAILFSKSVSSGQAEDIPGTYGGIDSKIVNNAKNLGLSLRCDIIKVSDHGSGLASSFLLLEEIKPKIAIISVGPNPPANLYPNPTTLRRLSLKGVSIYTTDRLGNIIISSKDGVDYTIYTDFPRDSSYASFLNGVLNQNKPYWGK
jgi:competence protein ComEC